MPEKAFLCRLCHQALALDVLLLVLCDSCEGKKKVKDSINECRMLDSKIAIIGIKMIANTIRGYCLLPCRLFHGGKDVNINAM